MRRTRLFGSVLAAMASLAGVNQTATDTPQIISTQQPVVQRQADTSTPATAPVANAVVQNLKAGALDVPIPVWITATPRWAWVGRKVNGKFGYYCRRVGA